MFSENLRNSRGENASRMALDIMSQHNPERHAALTACVAQSLADPAVHEAALAEAAQLQATGNPLRDLLAGRLVEYALTRDPAALGLPPTIPEGPPPAAEM